jgi:hypothetical protein
MSKSFASHVRKHHRLDSKLKRIVSAARKAKTESQMRKHASLLKAHIREVEAHAKKTKKIDMMARKSHSEFMKKMKMRRK